MDIAILKKKFDDIGARLKVGDLRLWSHHYWLSASAFYVRDSRGRHVDPSVRFRLDVQSDRHGRFFELLIRRKANTEFHVLDVKPKDRHLLLMVEEQAKGSAPQSASGRQHYLCGHDERDWFIAVIPGKVSTVEAAKETLKPQLVLDSQGIHGVKRRYRNKRKNDGFIRQGEWFFIPRPELQVSDSLVLKNEPLSRGQGKPHNAEFLFRRGTTVYVCRDYPNGLTESEYSELIHQDPKKKTLPWQVMVRDPEAYVKGKIRHPDHKTLVLRFWHRVVPNTESQTTSGQNLAFLD
jgi:hypothetical protein